MAIYQDGIKGFTQIANIVLRLHGRRSIPSPHTRFGISLGVEVSAKPNSPEIQTECALCHINPYFAAAPQKAIFARKSDVVDLTGSDLH